MARSRNIKPGFFRNEDLVELDFATRLLFAGLWTVADREGRLEDRPKKIKMDVFPADDVNVDTMLQELHDAHFITRYEANGGKYVQIANWSKHQNPHHTEKASEIPGVNGELTVKEPLKDKKAQVQDGGNLADSLIPDSLIPDSLHADAAAPSAVGGTQPADLPKDELWNSGKAYLVDRGVSSSQAGSFVGGLTKKFGAEIVVEVVREMLVESPAEPKGWMVAACQAKAGVRKAAQPNRQEALEQRNRAALADWVPPELRAQGAA